MDFVDDILDAICDGFEYIIDFSWLEDGWELVTGLFEDLGDFSIGGMVFGLLCVILIYFLRDYMLSPFLKHMSPISATFWGIATYVGCGAMGYLVGKKLFDD
ncbi:MAG TPA: hypothetical protein ENG87_01820 [Candidatus Pacearchaeota archaeon]|nr:hypothetical protein BMS3Abin17_00117 [archaeon BMS3Abin17]HDK42090.1 hypothetical protein [Candidatus Pacearchaeota archaeon]HDZ60142.1 hypothetical protein [Candidatus Pacearchaeota archaeon]